jgi:glycine/D-amino acid oxidase-like deaminating enzyme/nitrite reductase/ring-hydroxylating ferredoxin subunit
MYDAQRRSGESLPLWYEARNGARLGRDRGWPAAEVDVVIVGAGIAGLSTAYHLLKAGRSVVVLERGEVGCGETGRTTAHLASALDDHFYLLERMHGRRGARLAAESHAAAIESIEDIVASEQISCGFSRVDGYLFAGSPGDRRELEREHAAATRAGLNVSWVEQAPLPFVTGPTLRFGRQAQFQPVAYLDGLARVIARMGGHILTQTKVCEVEEDSPARVHVDAGGTITAQAVVIATNSPIIDRFSMHTKQAPYRTYVLALSIPKGTVPRALYWDTLDPYHYVRLAGADDLLIVGGEDHKCGQSEAPEESWLRLEAWTRAHFPAAGVERYRWSGQVWEPADGLAFIGKNPGRAENVFICTGDSGNGMTHGALAGLLLTDLILGRENRWETLYDPSRKITRPLSAAEYVRENLNVAAQYGHWLRPRSSDVRAAALGPCEGTVERRGVRRVAVYMDESGKRHECSAMCTHLGGIVAWNRAERSWDCPCHGSRFDPYGRVITGPAKRNLEPIREEREAPIHEPPSVMAE